MARIRDAGGDQGSLLPSGVTFFEGFNVNQVEEIDILNNWRNSTPHKSLNIFRNSAVYKRHTLQLLHQNRSPQSFKLLLAKSG